MSNDFKFLTPERVRSRIKNIKYEGDPDLHPIRSTENAFLVRTLYQIALKINESVSTYCLIEFYNITCKYLNPFQYGSNFYQLYHSPTFTGRLARQILCAPITIYRYDKTIPGSPRVSSNLPPRVSLRFMASYRFLIYLCFGAFIFWLLGYSVEFYLLFIITIFILYKAFRAVRSGESPVRHNYPTEGFGNISFSDSF